METYISEVAHLQAKVRLGLGWSDHNALIYATRSV